MTTLERPSLLLGDCLERLRELPDCSVDSVVTDPPYGLSFMGKKWDYDVPSVEVWAECLRVLKPGGYLLAFAGTRTQHRMAVRIEDAGFEIRDMIAWVYGSGFPKSLDVSKAIDKAAGAEREVVGHSASGKILRANGQNERPYQDGVDRFTLDITAAATDEAKQWAGWGTALKPALEPITVARKPLGEKTVAANVLAHGTGAINVDGGRVGAETWTRKGGEYSTPYGSSTTWNISKTPDINRTATGRWPANLIHDGSDEVVGLFPSPHGAGSKREKFIGNTGSKNINFGGGGTANRFGDSGSAARFFYCAKASKRDRDDGNAHPTVKPTDLMRYLCRLVTPPEGIVLDPFMGSGSTGKAAITEGFEFIGIERDDTYFEIAKKRIEKAIANVVLDNDL